MEKKLRSTNDEVRMMDEEMPMRRSGPGLFIRTSYFVLCTLFLAGAISSRAQYPGQHAHKIKVPLKTEVKAYSFDLSDVRLLSSPFKSNMEREGRWLLSLSTERLLHSFYVNAGMRTDKKDSKTKMPEPLGGWEALDMELRGHSMGHMLSGLSMQYASTGNEVFKQKGDSLVAALAEVQQVLGRDGYLSAYPEYYIDRNIAGKSVWAPWYTLHKILSGLIDMYWFTGNQKALDVANGMAAWSYKKLFPLSPEVLDRMLRNEFGGMNEAFYNLYSVTGNAAHLKLAQLFYHKQVLDPLAARQDKLNTLHANTIIPKITGEARGYELTGNEKQKAIAVFFWDTVIKGHTYAHGGNSDKEHFFEAGKLSEHLTGYTGETCNTYNMLKATRHLFTWSPEVKYADYYEQALYNHILGQQDPESGMVCYFTPMTPGAFRLYSTPDKSFWCCVGSGFESHSKYGEGIYYHDEKGVYVNLFIPSELHWKEKGISITQETKYPEEETVRLTITSENNVNMPLYIRYPSWATSGVLLKVNGRQVAVREKPGEYITLNRTWRNGDKIEITYPMSLRLVTTPDNSQKAAVAYGPVVLAAPMGAEGMKAPAPFHNPEDPYEYYQYDYNVPADLTHTLNTKGTSITGWLKHVAGTPLTFKTVNAAEKDITMIPYYKLHRERYVVYWDLE